MKVLLIADLDGNDLAADPVAKALSAVRNLGEVHVLIAGTGVQAAAESAATLDGVTRVLLADNPAYAHGMSETIADLVVSIAGGYSHIVGAATAFNKNLLPRIAALLDVMVISDVSAIITADTFERPIYAGNAIQTVKSSDPIKIISIRTANFTAAAKGGQAVIESVSGPAGSDLSAWVEDRLDVLDRPELTSARRVVSGGRGLGSKEHFALVEALADKLGAAIGASRAAVDSGFAPNDWQVGQTGKVVAPDLYIAVGISGAIQHLAGMKDSRIIVAINNDSEAPIFQVADYGLVGDLFDILPELTAKI